MVLLFTAYSQTHKQHRLHNLPNFITGGNSKSLYKSAEQKTAKSTVTEYLVTQVTKSCFVVYMNAFRRFSCQLSCTTNSTVVDNTETRQLSYIIQRCRCSTETTQIQVTVQKAIVKCTAETTVSSQRFSDMR